jgi:hypothetical protein
MSKVGDKYIDTDNWKVSIVLAACRSPSIEVTKTIYPNRADEPPLYIRQATYGKTGSQKEFSSFQSALDSAREILKTDAPGKMHLLKTGRDDYGRIEAMRDLHEKFVAEEADPETKAWKADRADRLGSTVYGADGKTVHRPNTTRIDGAKAAEEELSRMSPQKVRARDNDYGL